MFYQILDISKKRIDINPLGNEAPIIHIDVIFDFLFNYQSIDLMHVYCEVTVR